MKRVLLLCVMLALTCGATYATDYVWSAGAVSRPHDCATAYTPNITPPLTSADRLWMDNNAGGLGATMTFPASGTITLGAIQIDCGVMSFANTTATMRLVGGNGWGGDLTVRYSGIWDGYGGSKTFDVDGNVYFQKGLYSGWTSYTMYYSNLVMRGTGKTLDIDQSTDSDGWNSVTIYDCASVSAVRTPQMRNLYINGTITGGTWTVCDFRGDSSVQFGPSGQMTGGTIVMLHIGGTGTYLSGIGGGTYPALTILDPSGGANTVKRVIRLKGDVTVTNDFNYDRSYAGYITHTEAVLDTDNGSGKISNFTVNGNLRIGQSAGNNEGYPGWAYESGIVANSSTVTIGGTAMFDRYAYIKGGTSTWKFGNNVTFTSLYHYDNSDLKTTTFIINGTGAQALDFGNAIPVGRKLPLGDLIINKASGTATLSDNVLLMGDFKILAGTFSPGAYYLNFKGGIDCEALAQEIDVLGANLKKVHIMAGSNTWVKLLSNLTVSDNLDIDTGGGIFLNGFTLVAEGQTITTSRSWDQGQIVGGAIPEPATLLLLGTGALGALGYIRRQRMKR